MRVKEVKIGMRVKTEDGLGTVISKNGDYRSGYVLVELDTPISGPFYNPSPTAYWYYPFKSVTAIS